jgi:predicted nucleic acid-binding protein
MEIVNAFLTKSFFGLQDIILIEESLNKMNLTVTAIDHLVLKNSIDIAYENSLTLYDSIYIETARANNAVLLTEDKKILSAGKRYGFIRSLAEYKS